MSEIDLKSMSNEELINLLHHYESIAIQENLIQLTNKLQINSVYGAISNAHFVLFNAWAGSAITATGRYAIKSVSNAIISEVNNKTGKKSVELVINDTDSGYFCCDKLVSDMKLEDPDKITDFLDEFDKRVLNPLIMKTIDSIGEQLNFYENAFGMDREKIGEAMIVTGKKKYAIMVKDNEGVRFAHPKLKVTGLEIKRSSTPALMRKKLEEFLKLLFVKSNSEILKLIDKFRQEYLSKKFSIDEIAIPVGVSDIEKYINATKSVPINVRAAIVHNRVLNEKGLTDFQEIVSGDKIKWVYLKEPNPIASNVIAFNDSRFLKETGLDKYIDWKLMFEKTFISPLEKLFEAIGWTFNTGKIAMNDLF